MSSSVKNRRSQIDGVLSQYTSALSAYREEGEALEGALSRLSSAESARDFIQSVVQSIQQEVHEQITAVVSKGLQTVFDEPYQFKIDFEKKRGRTEARLIFERNGLELDPLSSSGGGVVDVAAFTLRVACLVLSRPSVRPLLILDEPFKNVSKANDYLDRIPSLLQSICKDLGIQIIMVTHIDELKVGKVIRIDF